MLSNTPYQTSIRYRHTSPGFQNQSVSSEEIALINQLAPLPLKPEQVYVRSMYLCSNQPCEADGCQFTRDALKQIAELVVGQSVLSGHNRSALPLARFYKSKVVEQNFDHGVSMDSPIYFVQAWFYWLRDTSGAKDLLLNIDGGIYREVSLAWRYTQWHCSICNAENGNCHHRVGEIYNNQRCFRLISQVHDVLEGSLVYKGADKNTHLSGMHQRSVDGLEPDEQSVLLIAKPDDPVLQTLQHTERICQTLSEADLECFRASLETLWLRGFQPDQQTQLARQYLCDGGMCLAETDQQDQISILQRQGNCVRTLSSPGE